MALIAYPYGQAAARLMAKEVNWLTEDIRAALVGVGYTPNIDTDDYWNDVVANEVAGTGYTAGGIALAGKTVAYDAALNQNQFKASNLTWSLVTVSWRYAVIYNRTPGTDATRPLLGYVDYGTPQSIAAGTIQLNWGSNGVLTFTVPT